MDVKRRALAIIVTTALLVFAGASGIEAQQVGILVTEADATHSESMVRPSIEGVAPTVATRVIMTSASLPLG